MSIAIVSVLPKSLPASASENAGVLDTASSGLDFTGLLLGQLFTATAETLPAAMASMEQPDTKSADISGDALQNDPASLLALMGLVPQQQAMSSNLTEADSGLVESASIATAPAASITVSTAQVTGDTDSLPFAKTATEATPEKPFFVRTGEGKSEETMPSVTTSAANDRQAAKFAVATASGTDLESLSANKATVEPGSPPPSPLASALPLHSAGHASSREVSLSVTTPVRDSQWDNDFSQKIVWLAATDKQTAELTLNPPHMGPIEISLNVDNGKASASFVSASAEVREAIETALPRLREMLAGAGIELGQANVGAESFRQPGNDSNGTNSGALSRNDNGILSPEARGTQTSGTMGTLNGNGLVDIFA